MLTVFNLKKGRELYAAEMAALTAQLDKYTDTPEGKWLASLNWQHFEFRWADAMAETDILGAYSVFSPNVIYIQPPRLCAEFNEKQNSDIYTEWAGYPLIVSTVVHELRHAYQHRKLGILYYIASTVGIRELLIERDAKRIEKQAHAIISRK